MVEVGLGPAEEFLGGVGHLGAVSAVEGALVVFLHAGAGVLEDADSLLAGALALLDFVDLLGLGEALVEHVLVVADQLHLALVLGVEVLLAAREIVLLLGEGGGVALLAGAEGGLRLSIRAKRVEVGALAVPSLVHGPEATTVLGDVSVSATAVVAVDDRLRVNMRSVLLGSGLLDGERA